MPYVDTFRGVCPNCNQAAPGHVRTPEADVDVYGWTCPRCEVTHDPKKVDRVEHPEEVGR